MEILDGVQVLDSEKKTDTAIIISCKASLQYAYAIQGIMQT